MTRRTIVVRGATFSWTLTPSDEGLRVIVRGEARRGSRLVAWFDHRSLVTPYSVRVAIERGLDEGWDPASAVHASVGFSGAQGDRPVAVEPPPALDAMELALLDGISDAREGDDGPRIVYADWLGERGDPQGELIALSCVAASRPLLPAEANRLAELERDRHAWLGPVGDVAFSESWYRGALDSLVLARKASGVVDPALGHRAWRTVRTIEARGQFVATGDIVRLLTQPALRDLRRLAVHGGVGPELAAHDHVFPRLTHFMLESDEGAPSAELVAALCARMPSLRELVLPPLTQVRLHKILAVSTAATLVVRDGSFSLAANMGRILEEAAPPGLSALVSAPWWRGLDDPGPTLRLARGPDGRWSALAIAWHGDAHPPKPALLIAALGMLPPDSLTTVTIDRSREPRRAPTPSPLDDAVFIRELSTALAGQVRVAISVTR